MLRASLGLFKLRRFWISFARWWKASLIACPPTSCIVKSYESGSLLLVPGLCFVCTLRKGALCTFGQQCTALLICVAVIKLIMDLEINIDTANSTQSPWLRRVFKIPLNTKEGRRPSHLSIKFVYLKLLQETDRLLGQQYNDDNGYYDTSKVGHEITFVHSRGSCSENIESYGKLFSKRGAWAYWWLIWYPHYGGFEPF